jgi:hypothetical protein
MNGRSLNRFPASPELNLPRVLNLLPSTKSFQSARCQADSHSSIRAVPHSPAVLYTARGEETLSHRSCSQRGGVPISQLFRHDDDQHR